MSGWSATLAADVTPLLVSSARALMADSLLSLAYDLTGPSVTFDDDAYARGAWWLVSLAIEAVSDADSADAWLTVLDAVEAAGTDRDAIRLALQPSLSLLTGPRDAAWPALADLQQLATTLLAPVDAAPTTAIADQAAVPSLVGAEPAVGTAKPGGGEPTPTVPPPGGSFPAVPCERRGATRTAASPPTDVLSSWDGPDRRTPPGASSRFNPQDRRRLTARW